MHIRIRATITVMLLLAATACNSEPKPGNHLFILSGQSNMVRLDPDETFRPTLENAFSESEITIVKDAMNGQPIRRWYRGWRSPDGEKPRENGDLYRNLMRKVEAAMGEKSPDTVTVVWMQGEADARESNGEVYAQSLQGLFDQFRTDLGRDDIHFVIGRISDFDNQNQQRPHWTLVREEQVKAVEAEPAAVWIDTDDLNGPRDDLHYTSEGFAILGKRFAKNAARRIESETE